MAPHSSTLAWKIPWMEEPGRLQSMGSLRVRHDWATSLSLSTFMHWRRKWQSTPVFLPGESHGRRSLVGCSPWGRRVGHDWSDLAAAVDPIKLVYLCNFFKHKKDCIILTEPCTAYWRTAWPLLYPVQRTGLQHHPQSGPCMFNMDYGSRLGRQSQNHLVGTDAVGERETYNSEMDQYI